MEPTLALRHADRRFAIVDGCARAMNNAKMAEWACPIKQISCFYFALLNKCRCFSQFIAVASHLKRPQPCTMPTLSNVCSRSTKSFRLICAKQRINQALRRYCLVRTCVRVSVGKRILSWINFAGAHFKFKLNILLKKELLIPEQINSWYEDCSNLLQLHHPDGADSRVEACRLLFCNCSWLWPH